MGKRSQSRMPWPKHRAAPAAHTVRLWICAGCQGRGLQLIAGPDGKQRCPRCTLAFDRDQESVLVAVPHIAAPIIAPPTIVKSPRVG